MRAAGLRAGTGEALAAEGLNADDGADHVAVDVEVADAGARRDPPHGGLDTAVDAEGQAVARRVDRIDDAVEVAGPPADDVQHGPEHLAVQQADAVDLEDVRREEGAARRLGVQVAAGEHLRRALHMPDMVAQPRERRGVDDRADIRRQQAGVADPQFGDGAGQHGENPGGDILLQEQDARRGTALAGAVEGGQDDVVDDLLRQGGGIDDHGVLATGLGDQRHDRSRPGGQHAADAAGRVGRAGEGDAGDAQVGDEQAADLAAAGQQVQHVFRDAGAVQQPHRGRGDQRRLAGGLGHHGVAGGECGGDLAGEDRQREVPGADAGEHAAAVQPEPVLLARRAG